jgi:DNA-binding beta-propeller fold protein YncE
MTVLPATKDTVYEPVPLWAKIPHGLWLREATSVAVDSRDRVYVFNRGNMPVMVFDRDGNLVHYWGNDNPYAGVVEITDPYGNPMKMWAGNQYTWAHSIRVDSDDNVWLVDTVGNKIYKTDITGQTKLSIGTGVPTKRQGGEPFNRPTDIAVHEPTGDLFISDGYGNSRIHRYDKDGNLKFSWGEPGADPGQFSVPHNLAITTDGFVVVCDRENHRVQVFTLDGEFVREWHVHKACAVFAGKGADTNIYIGEQGPPALQFGVPNLGHRVSIWTIEGKLVNRIGNPLPGEAPDQFLWPHSVAVDSEGSIYVADVSYVEVGSRQNPPREMVSLHKWRRVRG